MRGIALCTVLVTAAIGGACQEPDQTFGEPNGIVGKKLPNEGDPAPSTGGGGAPVVTVSMKSKHAGGKGPDPGPKIVCLTCHVAGGSAPEFSFGGQSVVGATIAVTGQKPVGCDTDGYFWLEGPPLKAGSRATCGKGTSSKSMGGAIAGVAGGSCDGAAPCHGSPDTLKIEPGE